MRSRRLSIQHENAKNERRQIKDCRIQTCPERSRGNAECNGHTPPDVAVYSALCVPWPERSRRLRSALCILLVSWYLGGAAGAAPVEPEKTFGFSGMEFHKLDWDTRNLRLADINGDGLTDILVVNNARARVECLVQRAKPGEAPPPTDVQVNEILNDTRFESRPFLSEKRIFSLEMGDLNKDGRTDMAYYGDPRELVVVYQGADGRWGARRTFDIADGATHQDSLAIGDLNGDGRNDIALLAADGIYLIYQNAAGKLEAPVKEAGIPEGAFAIVIKDFNGDRRPDLLYVCSNETAPFCFRFQNEDGRLGPEVRCKAPPIRAAATGDVDGDGAEEIIAIQMATGRLVCYKTAVEPAGGGLLDAPFERYALRAPGSRRPHAIAFGALAGSKRMDIVVTDPDAAEVEIFSQDRPGLWNRKAAFPSLQGVTDIALLDADGDGAAELLVLSPEEPMLGLARAGPSGRFTFPRALPVAGKPTCMTVADLNGDGKPEILYASADDRARAIHVLAAGGDGQFQEVSRIPIEDARADPDGILVADANQDGLNDILLFTPYQEMRIFKAMPEGKFVDVSRGADYGKGLVQGARLKSVALADVNRDGKPEILLAYPAKNFARALRLDAKDRIEVVEQFNGRSPTSQIVGVAAADLDGDGRTEVVLVDASNRCLTALKPSAAGAYEIVENLQIGAVNLEKISALDLIGKGKPAVVLLGQNDFSILQLGMPRTVLREIASYETPIRDGRLDNVAVGSLRGKGRPEILVSEGTKQVMELLVWSEDGPRLRRALVWPIFEARAFPGSRFGPGAPPASEPREFDIGDVTNDGKPDIVLLIHDRILVYPQE